MNVLMITNFAVFFRLCGVDCVRVSGFCKGHDYNPGDSFKNKEPNHQWNCVNLDGIWRLVDCCWGAGYIDETSGYFVQTPRSLYFFTDPRIFIMDHFPSDSKWQLMSSPIDLKTFETTANIKYGYTMHKVQLCNQKNAVITCKGKCNIQLAFPKPLDISYKLLDKNLISVDAYVDYCLQRNHVNIQCTLPFLGAFTLVVYGKEGGNKESTFKSIVNYTINNISETSRCNLDQSRCLCPSWGPSPNFYEMQLRQRLPVRTAIPCDTSKVPLCLNYYTNNSHLQLKGDLYRLDTIVKTKLNNLTFTNRRTNGERQVLVKVPRAGDYALKLYARLNTNAEFQLVANYRVKDLTSTSGMKPFPQMTARWLKENCTLFSPFSGIVKTDENLHVRLMIENALDVIMLLPERKTVRLKLTGGDLWETKCDVGSMEGNAQIFVKIRTDQCYYKYLQYFIQKSTMGCNE